jgi:tetratricopeptide (TPR) repeat protein
MRPRATLLLIVFVGAVITAGADGSSSLGRLTFPTSGPPAAQTEFIRGVLLLHSFEYDEALLVFRHAEQIAPDFAMAYWGEAMCYNQPLWRHQDLAKARAALNRLGPTPASRASVAPTARERGYLDALERLYGDGDAASRTRAYADRMGQLSRDYPWDDEAALFYALALLATIPEGERNPEVAMRAGAIASAVLTAHPDHPGAAHYVLHAYDDGEHNARGLTAARIYAKLAPGSSHALHMPSHVFLPLGMWDEAVSSDEASFAASVAWVTRTGRTIAQQDFHSLSWLHYEYLQQGRFAKAREAEATVSRAIMASGPRHGNDPGSAAHQHESEIGRGYGAASLQGELASMRARYVIESRDWSRMTGQSRFENIDELFAVGLSGIAHGDMPRGDTAIAHLHEAARAVAARDAREIAGIMASELEGVLRFAKGDRAGGLTALQQAVAAEAARPRPIARPYPIKPAAELYGELLLAAGRPADAAAAFERALERTPRRAASLLGLASAALASGNRDQAARTARELIAMWHLADADRPELADARQLLEEASR